MDGHRNAAGDGLDGGFGEPLALRDGEIERLALVVRPGDGGRPGADMKVQHLLEGRQIKAEVVLERRDRALHHAAEFVRHDLKVCWCPSAVRSGEVPMIRSWDRRPGPPVAT